MNSGARGLHWHTWHSDQVKYRQTFCKRSSKGADGAQFTYAIGRVNRTNSVDASIPVSGVGGIQFVAASDPLDSGKVDNRILYGESVVAGYAKDFGYSDVLEP